MKQSGNIFLTCFLYNHWFKHSQNLLGFESFPYSLHIFTLAKKLWVQVQANGKDTIQHFAIDSMCVAYYKCNRTYGAKQINTQWNHMGNTVFSWAKFIGLTKTNSHWVLPLLKTCTWIIFSEFCSAKGLILTHRLAFKFWWWLCL